jgi:hypothetical protein
MAYMHDDYKFTNWNFAIAQARWLVWMFDCRAIVKKKGKVWTVNME